VQPQGKIRDLPGGPGRRVSGARVALAQLRRHYLLDQVGLPVGRGLDRPQVPGLHPVLAERGHHPGDREGLRTVLPADPADQAVVLQLGQQFVIGSGGFQQLAAGHRRGDRFRRASGRARIHRVQPFLDHPQWQVFITLRGQDETQPLNVRDGEPAVPGLGPLRLNQPLGLQEADLRGADVGEFLPQFREHLTDAYGAGRSHHA